MPKSKYKFAGPEYIQVKIVKPGGATVGFIRVKPSSVLWKPANKQEFYSVTLDDFTGWITSKRAGASKTSR